MTPAIAAFAGTVSYEFRMQVRRPAVWIAIGGVALLVMGRTLRGNLVSFRGLSPFTLEANVAAIGSYFLPVVFGILLADRLPRERRLDADQAVFLNERARCTTADCIERSYQIRIGDLESVP